MLCFGHKFTYFLLQSFQPNVYYTMQTKPVILEYFIYLGPDQFLRAITTALVFVREHCRVYKLQPYTAVSLHSDYIYIRYSNCIISSRVSISISHLILYCFQPLVNPAMVPADICVQARVTSTPKRNTQQSTVKNI